MKGIINGVSKVSLSGSLTSGTSTFHNDGMIHSRLRRLYSEANQRVFLGIVPILSNMNAQRFTDIRFRAEVKKALLNVAKSAYPESGYDENSDYSVLYIAVNKFIQDRDDKLGRNPIRR